MKVSGGGSGTGTLTEILATELKVRYVPFNGSGPSNIALLGGHVDFRFCNATEAVAMIRAGKTRGLAVSSEKRWQVLPDVPTFKELGIFGGAASNVTYVMWGPPQFPSNLVNTITKMIENATKDPGFIKICREQIMQTGEYQTPEKLKEVMNNFERAFGPKLAEANK